MTKLKSLTLVATLMALCLAVVTINSAFASVATPAVPETANCTLVIILMLITTTVLLVPRRKGEHFQKPKDA